MDESVDNEVNTGSAEGPLVSSRAEAGTKVLPVVEDLDESVDNEVDTGNAGASIVRSRTIVEEVATKAALIRRVRGHVRFLQGVCTVGKGGCKTASEIL